MAAKTDTPERIPSRNGLLADPGDLRPDSMEAALAACLSEPEASVEPTESQRRLSAALDAALRSPGEDVALDLHRCAYVVYEVLLGHPLSDAARHERSPWLNVFRSRYESQLLQVTDSDTAEAIARCPEPTRASSVRDWFLAEAKERNATDRAVEEHLAERASVEELARFIQADGYLNYRFFDALVLAQPHFMERVKHEISLNMWDECGRGEARAAHTAQFSRSLSRLGMEIPVVPVWNDWRPYAGHNLYFALGMNRRHLFKALGSLAMPELFDVDRDAAVVRGLERHGYSARTDFEFFHNHVEGDAEHGPEWLDGVVVPIVEAEPDAGPELIVGGALRMRAMRLYNEYLAASLGIGRSDGGLGGLGGFGELGG